MNVLLLAREFHPERRTITGRDAALRVAPRREQLLLARVFDHT